MEHTCGLERLAPDVCSHTFDTDIHIMSALRVGAPSCVGSQVDCTRNLLLRVGTVRAAEDAYLRGTYFQEGTALSRYCAQVQRARESRDCLTRDQLLKNLVEGLTEALNVTPEKLFEVLKEHGGKK